MVRPVCSIPKCIAVGIRSALCWDANKAVKGLPILHLEVHQRKTIVYLLSEIPSPARSNVENERSVNSSLLCVLSNTQIIQHSQSIAAADYGFRLAHEHFSRKYERVSGVQVLETMTGGMDPQVMERMVKIMSYMRGSSGKGGKLKRKEKLRMLQVRLRMTHHCDARSNCA